MASNTVENHFTDNPRLEAIGAYMDFIAENDRVPRCDESIGLTGGLLSGFEEAFGSED